MSDLISRQAAIDAIRGEIEINGYGHIIDVLRYLPSAHPERTDCTECPDYDQTTKSCDKEIIRQELEQKCWIPSEINEPAKRLNDLIFDINPAEICAQIEADNLKKWCEIIQTEMKMAMVQLPCWEGES